MKKNKDIIFIVPDTLFIFYSSDFVSFLVCFCLISLLCNYFVFVDVN